MKEIKLQSLFSKFVIITTVLSFINIDYVFRMGFGNTIRVLQMLSSVLIVVCLLIRGTKFTMYILLWFLLCMWVLAVTLFNGQDIEGAIRLIAKIMVPVIFFAVFKNDFEFILRCIYTILGVLVVVNFVTILLFPNGMYVTGITNFAYENWLLGFKNKQIIYFLPLLLTTSYLYVIDGISFDKVTILCILLASSALVGSSTALISIVTILAFGFIPFFRNKYRVLNAPTYLFVGLFSFITIVLLRLQNYFSYLIVNIIGKNLSLSNRTLLWDKATEEISNNFLTGRGYWSPEAKHMLYRSQSIISAHNQLLEYMFTGGAVLVFLYLATNVLLVSRLYHHRIERAVQLASVVYFGMLIVMLTEVYEDYFFYALYSMIWLAPNVVEIAENKQYRSINND